jgi:hypothetical protein
MLGYRYTAPQLVTRLVFFISATFANLEAAHLLLRFSLNLSEQLGDNK